MKDALKKIATIAKKNPYKDISNSPLSILDMSSSGHYIDSTSTSELMLTLSSKVSTPEC